MNKSTTQLIILLMSIIILSGCVQKKVMPQKESPSNSDIEFTTLDLSTKKKFGEIDHTKPQAVVQAIFDSASSKDLSYLPKLCDPKGENDERTKRICDLLEVDKMLFIIEFENGKVLGEGVVEGDIAKVPYAYGYDGSDEQTMELIKRDGQWYLYHFFSK